MSTDSCSLAGVAAIEAARDYLKRGFAVLPIPFGTKAPTMEGWPNLRLTEADLARHFTEPSNIGVLLGDPSGGLIDVDLDCPEAVALAPRFLPETGAVFGRASNPSSHRLYSTTTPVRTARYQSERGETLAEVRSTGAQTVFPPSVHSGEAVSWEQTGSPALVNGADLQQAVALVSAAAFLARRWPSQGSRQDAALALAGGLARIGWPSERVADFIAAVATVAGDEESAKRAKAAEFTQQRIVSGASATGWPRLEELLGKRVVDLVAKWLGAKSRSRSRDNDALGSQKDGKAVSQTQALLAIAGAAELFHTPEGEAFAAVPVNRHTETWPIASRGFRDWLRRSFHAQSGKAVGSQALQDALANLEALARFDGPERSVFLRIGKHDGAMFLDLCNAEWEAVMVTAGGWEVVPRSPIPFRRTKGMRPLFLPARGGSIELLRKYVNAPDERTWVLIVAFLIGAYRPTGPYPILVLQGEAGSAKSTVSRLLRMLVDPSSAPLRTLPRDERDLFVAAQNGYLLNFDNLSSLTSASSDALCRLATGGGLSTRELYTNSDEVIFDATRPLILNGIDDLASRADLADRAMVVSLGRIADAQRRPESDLFSAFEADWPLILGALLHAVSCALRNQASVRLPWCPRMADFAIWVSAAEPALDWRPGSFLEMYEEQRRDAAAAGVETDEVIGALVSFVDGVGEWTGTASELLVELNKRADEVQRRGRGWPQSPRALASIIRRAAPFLRDAGIQTTLDQRAPGSRRRLMTFRKCPENIVPIVPTVPAPLNSTVSGRDEVGRCTDSEGGFASHCNALNPHGWTGRDDWDDEKPDFSNSDCAGGTE